MESNHVILSNAEKVAWESGRAKDFRAARDRWQPQAKTYAAKIRPLVERVLDFWTVLPSE